MAAGDWPGDPYFFASREAAEECRSGKIAEGWEVRSTEVVELDVPQSPLRATRVPQVHIGPRGGAYTEDVTMDGRPYRRYF